jgi:hypothetical protein
MPLEYLVLIVLTFTAYLYILEKAQQKNKIPFTDLLSKIN